MSLRRALALKVLLRTTESALEAVGGENKKLKNMGGRPQTHPLGETFFSQVPVRYGDYIAGVGAVPGGSEWVSDA